MAEEKTKVVLRKENYEPESWALYCKVIDANPDKTTKIVVVDDGKNIQLQPYRG